MRYLLDTHTLAWAVGDPERLGDRARSLLLDRENALLISPASVWEMSIKHHRGRWPEVAPFMDERLYRRFVRTLQARELPIDHRHARLAGRFDLPHRDPFDRLLAAQALLEDVPLVSQDPAFDRFPVARVW